MKRLTIIVAVLALAASAVGDSVYNNDGVARADTTIQEWGEPFYHIEAISVDEDCLLRVDVYDATTGWAWFYPPYSDVSDWVLLPAGVPWAKNFGYNATLAAADSVRVKLMPAGSTKFQVTVR